MQRASPLAAVCSTSFTPAVPYYARTSISLRGGSRRSGAGGGRTVIERKDRRAVRQSASDGSAWHEEEGCSSAPACWEADGGGVIFSGEEIARVVEGELLRGGPRGSIGTDSRSLLPGQWFVALDGYNFDGYAFVEDAARAGCAGAVSSRAPPTGWTGGYVVVADTLLALQRLAADVRNRFKGPVVGITGSVGKTTTRALTALALRSFGEVHHTRGNLNNHVGVPLTLLRMPATTEVCVLELGMSGFGEIARLAEIARPTVRVVINVAPVHLEGVGGSLQGVARAKGELFATAVQGDICVVNADDTWVSSLPVPPGCEVLTFGTVRQDSSDEAQPDIVLSGVRSTGFREVTFSLTETARGNAEVTDVPSSSDTVTISEPGAHLAMNAAAAAAVAAALGLPLSDVCRDLCRFESLEMRMRVIEVPARGILCLDDSYNASPASVRSALRTLHNARQGQPEDTRRAVVLLGDMLELGPHSLQYHEDILDACLDHGFDLVGLVGPEYCRALASVAARGGDVSAAVAGADAANLWEKVKGAVNSGPAVVLVKGSRGMKMDYIVQRLTRSQDELRV
uniref:UDP-MurNAc-pentapeptide synthetase n=1 Tax=Mantoniella antarctica TaxID=81844 RepID=A0A7S0XB89_9CHLO|mmetsp:Transcript_32549/g.81981  ORF Transcript_32549/g.81981 Transcript_32549/m.81981 type:complete len:570 (+) Transcript_32549:210-1919(+)